MTTLVTTPTQTKTIAGAVLESSGAQQPYAASRPIKVGEVQLQAPAEHEVLIRITAAGVCHSDLSVVNNDRPRPLPMLLGHEATGVVESVGSTDSKFKVGDHVVATFLPRCGTCEGCRSEGKVPCISGSRANEDGVLLSGGRKLTRDGAEIKHHIGVSGFATHAVMSEKSLVKISADVPPEIAAVFGCAILTGGGAVLNVLKPKTSDHIAVVGLGGVGMSAVLTAAAIGVENITAIDLNADKRSQALEMGATKAMSPAEAEAAGPQFAAVVEAAGHPAALTTAWRITQAGGTTCTVGLPAPGQTIEVDPLMLTSQARTLIGSYLGSSVPEQDIPIYERLWREGKLHAEKLISSKIQLDQVNEAMDELAAGNVLRQIIMFPEPQL